MGSYKLTEDAKADLKRIYRRGLQYSRARESSIRASIQSAMSFSIRNVGEYEGDLNIDEQFVADLITACCAVADKLDHQLVNPKMAQTLAFRSIFDSEPSLHCTSQDFQAPVASQLFFIEHNELTASNR